MILNVSQLKLILLSFTLTQGAISCGGGSSDSSGASESQSTTVEGTSAPQTAAPTVSATNNIPPVLTWDDDTSSLTMFANVVHSSFHTSTSDQASAINYEFNTVTSTCLTNTIFEEITLSALTGELRTKPHQNVEATCKIFIEAKSETTTVTKELDVTVTSTVNFSTTPNSFSVNEDEAISGRTLLASSSALLPVISLMLDDLNSTCDEHAFSTTFDIDSNTGLSLVLRPWAVVVHLLLF